MRSINPYTNVLINNYQELSYPQINKKLLLADNSFLSWKKTDMAQRSRILHKTADVLRNNAKEYASLMTSEMGKLIKSGISEVNKCAWVCDYYADNAENFLNTQIIETDASKSYITYNPLGTLLAIMPWNFPFWQVFRFAAPALMAGNTCVLKHASNVSGCALAIEKIFLDAGLPYGVFQTLLVSSSKVEYIIEHPVIKAITLTGSTPAGIAVAAKAGSVLKKTVLELGGNDAYIILEDADIDEAVRSCFTSKMINAGQSCIAAKRFIVVDKIRKEFEDKFTELMKEVKIGDPEDPETELGPLAREDLRDELHEQVNKSIKKGAICLLGAYIPNEIGALYPATVLTNVKKGMPAYDEELFGPVVSIISAKDRDDAIRLANDSQFGLGSAVFTSNLDLGEKTAALDLDAGSCFVNDFVRSDPRLPFGGIKESGYGRELSKLGILEFVNIKTIYIK